MLQTIQEQAERIAYLEAALKAIYNAAEAIRGNASKIAKIAQESAERKT